jgi:predicted PurR-regulated permease PerM
MARRPQNYRALLMLAGWVLVMAVLYVTSPVTIPVALAILLTFLLSPIANLLQRWHLGKTFPVILMVFLLFSVAGGIGWLLFAQVQDFANELPNYRSNIRGKIAQIKHVGEGQVGKALQETADTITDGLQTPESEKPTLVKVVNGESPILAQMPRLFEALGSAGLVLVLLIFMLLQRKDLLDRLIMVIGHGRLTLTTKALDEASDKISRYLLIQAGLNASYGLAIGVGLYFIGVKYALLWGCLAFLLRFVPYVGPWIAAAFPIALSLAIFPGWAKLFLVGGLFIVIELVSNMVLEPIFYGKNTGASSVALLIAIAFWTWLWGPVGLVLATPLTVCLVVIGKYVPQLRFVTILLADEPLGTPQITYYQRLLAKNQDEAMRVVDEHLKAGDPESVYDDLMLPALCAIKRDRDREEVTLEDEQFVYQATRKILEVLGTRRAARAEEVASDTQGAAPPVPKVMVLGCPAADEADELSLYLLREVLADSPRCELVVLDHNLLAGEVLDVAKKDDTPIICIGVPPPGGLTHARYLVKRFRTQRPDVRIIAGRWACEEDERDVQVLQEAGADRVATSLVKARKGIEELLHELQFPVRSAG